MARKHVLIAHPGEATIRKAAQAVVELATLALEPQYLIWDKVVNLGVVEGVWNAASFGDEAKLVLPEDERLAGLIERLIRVRRTRWPHVDSVVFGLDMRHADGEVLFAFDLTFDGGDTFHPCEIAWDMPLARSLDVN